MATDNDGNGLDSKGNVQVDFVWGNLPLQPDDARTNELNLTDPVHNNHELAVDGWSGFPGYAPNTKGQKTAAGGTVYVVVPSVLTETTAAATKALQDVGLVVTVNAATAGGGTSGTIKAQSIAAGAASVAVGAAINITPVL